MNDFERGNKVNITGGIHEGKSGIIVEAFEYDDIKQPFRVKLNDGKYVTVHESNLVRDTREIQAIMHSWKKHCISRKIL